MVSRKLVVILWIACSTTWVQAYVDNDPFKNWLEGDDHDLRRRNVEDYSWEEEQRAHQKPSYGFDSNLDNHQEFHQVKLPVYPQQGAYLDQHQPEVHLKLHPENSEVINPQPGAYLDQHQPEVHPEPHPENSEVINPQPGAYLDQHQPEVHPETPEKINSPQEGHSDLQQPKLHPEVPKVIDPHQEDHPNLYQLGLDHPVPLAPYPVTAPNSGHLPAEAQPVTPVSNDSPHSAKSPEESFETEESSSTFSTEPSTLSTSEDYSTEDYSTEGTTQTESEPLVESPTDSRSEKFSMEMTQILLIVGIFLGAIISLLSISTVVYVLCRSAKARGEYAVKMSDLKKNNKEIAEV